MRRAGIVLLGLLFACVLWYLLADQPGTRPDDLSAPAEPAAGMPEPGLEARAPDPAPGGAAPPAKPKRVGVMVGREPARGPHMAATYRCRVLLVDGDTAFAPKQGSVKVMAWDPDDRGGGIHDCEVTDGAFSVIMRHGKRIGVRSMVLDGVPAVEVGVDPGTKHVVSPDQVLEIRAQHVRKTVLRVVSKETGRELAGVDVVDGTKARGRSPAHPGWFPKSALLARSATSPVEVAAPSVANVRHGFQGLFVRAEGHAWQEVRVDPLAGGVRRVELPRAGTVVVRIEPGLQRTGRFVKVAGGNSSPFPAAVVPVSEAGETVIESVEVGEYRIDLAEAGIFMNQPAPEASSTVTVRAEEIVQVVFRSQPDGDPQTVPFSGTLELSAEWHVVGNVHVRVARADLEKRRTERRRKVKLNRTSERSSARQTFAWDAGLVRAGMHICTFQKKHRQQAD